MLQHGYCCNECLPKQTNKKYAGGIFIIYCEDFKLHIYI